MREPLADAADSFRRIDTQTCALSSSKNQGFIDSSDQAQLQHFSNKAKLGGLLRQTTTRATNSLFRTNTIDSCHKLKVPSSQAPQQANNHLQQKIIARNQRGQNGESSSRDDDGDDSSHSLSSQDDDDCSCKSHSNDGVVGNASASLQKKGNTTKALSMMNRERSGQTQQVR